MKSLLLPFLIIFQLLGFLVRAIFGDISWRPPGWAASLKTGVVRRPVLLGGLTVSLLALVIAGGMYWNWYIHQPKPTTVDWMVNTTPGYSAAPEGASVGISFMNSVVKLEKIGKDVTADVDISPKIAGKWISWNGNQITFTPTEHWAADTDYQVTFSPSLFSPNARLATLTKQFRSQPFTVAINAMSFYVNPTDPTVKQVTATLNFSYPVDRASLEKSVTLAMETGPNVFNNVADPTARRTITYDPDQHDCVAYVRSVNIQVPDQTARAILTVPKAVMTTCGTAHVGGLDASTMIPSASDLFHVNSAQPVIVNNTDGEPEQTLVIQTSVGVKPELLAQSIHAWVLPNPHKHKDPTTGQKAEVWHSPAEVDAAVLVQAKPVALTLVPNGEEYATLNSFKLKAPENGWLYVRIDKGLASIGGFVLVNGYDTVGRVPPYPRVIHITNEGSLLALSGERKLSIMSRGIEQLEYRLERVTPGQINNLVSQSEGDFSSPVFSNYNFNESNIAERIVRHQDIADSGHAKNNYSALDFTEFVRGGKNDGKLGLFILRVMGRNGDDGDFYKQDGGVVTGPSATHPTVRGWDDSNNEDIDPTDGDDMLADRRLILVTDLGLLIKDNADGTHDVFVQSIKTGEPVDGAKVEVLGKNGLPIVTAETDDGGRATLPALRDFTREKKPVAYVVTLDNDVSFLPFGRQDRLLNFSRFDTSGISGEAPDDLTAFVFTDRGIYRPGDTAELGLIVKQHNWQGKLDGMPLRLDVVDPRGTVVQSRLLKLNAEGFLESTFQTRETTLTGKYNVQCFLVKGGDDDLLLGSQTLRVAEFLPDRMKIKATLSSGKPEGWVTPEGLTGNVSLQNLYGTPSIGHRMKGTLALDPSQFSFDKYPDYTFVDPCLNPNLPRKSYSTELPEKTTDEKGEASFDLQSKDIDQSAYQLSFMAEGFEKEGGRSVTDQAGVLISPRAWLVGFKPDGDFGYIKAGTKRFAHFLAVDPHLKPLAASHLKMKIVEERYLSVLTQQPNGNYAYDSVLKEIPAGEEALEIPAGGLNWLLKTTQPGDFAARLYDEDDKLVADVRYSVVGAGNVTRSLEKNAELTAKLSKPEYLPGDEIEVEITAPYTGAGLLTIERDKVYAHAWFVASTTSTVQKIRLPKDFEGSGYLNVAFVRALDSKEIYMSPLSYAVLPFKVNQEARHTLINIDVPKVALPGKPLEMKVSASRPTRAVVYAVDEGILQVARYTLPDPLDYFFRKMALEVGTRQTVDLILPEYSIVLAAAAAGGGEGDDSLAHHLNPFKRKRDKPVAYWSGIVDLGPEAKTFTYDVPDYYAGTLHVMVVTDTAEAVGSAETKLQVRGPFVISPNVPTFVAPGDTFAVTAAIANNITGSGDYAHVNVSIALSDNLEVVEKPDAAVTIAEGHDASVRWLLRAKDALGDADITISAENDGKKAALASHLSIRPPVPYLTTLASGYFQGHEQSFSLTRKLYPEYSKTTALVSPLPQGFTRGLGDYLEHYEYGCTEQLVSKAFPSLVTDQTMEQGLTRSQVAEKVQEIIGVAAARQNDEGAFGLWYAEPNVHFDLPSAWVMLFLIEAKEQGYDIPADLLTRGLGHLQSDANGVAQDFFQARVQAMEVYLLARNGAVVTNAVEHNRIWFENNQKERKDKGGPDRDYDWHDDIAAVYDAATYALLKNQDQADALLDSFHFKLLDVKYYYFWSDYYDNLGRGAQYVYLVTRHFPERAKSISPDDLMVLAQPIMGGEYSTISAAQAILALDSYARLAKGQFQASGVEIDQVVSGLRKKLELSDTFYPGGPFDRTADSLVFMNGTKQTGLFYQVAVSGFDHTTVTQPITDGLEVSREYFRQDDPDHRTPVTSAKLGEELTVVLRVRATESFVTNVAIEDLLPGGFEIVEESARTGPNTWNWGGIDYVDVREDRFLAFGDISGDGTTITYRVKATNRGTYVIPPPQAESMYHQKIRGRGTTGTLTVED